jgi:hypothetical protein
MPPRSQRELLANLPTIGSEEYERAELTLGGFLVRSASGRVRLLTNDLCFDFDELDVVRIVERAPRHDNAAFAIPVTLFLRPGTRVLDTSSSETYWELVTGCRPFAVATRPDCKGLVPSDRFLRMQEEFLRAYGIDVHDLNRL